jgi:ATP-binding cassette, subfamily B, bacterial
MNIPLKAYWNLLSEYIRPQKWRFSLLAVLMLGSIGLKLINPQIMRGFIDATQAGASLDELIRAGLAFLGIALFLQGVTVGVAYLGEDVAWRATNRLRADLARKCLYLDMGFHNEHTPGELIERIDGDVAELAKFFSQFVIVLVGNFLLMLGILVVLMLEDWRIGVAFSIYALISLVILNRIRDLAMPYQKERRQAEAELFGFLEEQMNSTEDIRANGSVSFSLRELYRLQAAILRPNRKAHWKSFQVDIAMGGLLTVGNILVIVTSFLLFRNDLITLGTVYLFINYFNMLEGPIWELTYQIRSFQTIGACVERLTELKAIPNRITDGPGGTIPEGALQLHFENVRFAYSDGDPVLHHLSFDLQPGKVLGLLGRTGSGKSTLARLIFRLYDPEQGRVCLNELDIRDAKLEALRGRVAMVTQDVQIFRASVRENLTFFDPTINDDRIMEAIDSLELTDWLHNLPQGLDTKLETGAHSLSAGEAQLLAFTRVLLRKPGLVILDEASSRLDPATEERIERAVERLLKERTAIIIAHRLGTVERADEIMILANGHIQEYGSRLELSSDPHSRFSQLMKTGLEEVLA